MHGIALSNPGCKFGDMYEFSLAIHGGAGTILAGHSTPELEAAYKKALQNALDAGREILADGGSAQQAVVAAVVSLEDCPLFNAGKGSVFTKEGKHEMDASIMRGYDRAAGSCCGVAFVQNPVLLAEAIMEKSDHVMLSHEGALRFALDKGLAIKPDEYFFTRFRFDQWASIRDEDTVTLDHNLSPFDRLLREKKFGTVGAVAKDRYGNVAAATSTGGMTNKRYNRIGDSPVIGSGCYASNQTCAISCTGHGEYFLRAVAAYDVSCLMEYAGLSLEQAMQKVVLEKLKPIGGEGGMIGVNSKGEISLVFNSAGMYRGFALSSGETGVAIYA